MFCTKCGKDNVDGNKFCIECGQPLKKPAQQNSVQENVATAEEPIQAQSLKEPTTTQGSDKGTTILGDETKIVLTRQDGKEFKLSSFPVSIGKGSTADCIIDGDESVSRQHACIHENGSEGYVIEDLNSTNKTYLNGYQLKPEELVVLNDDDEVKMGSSVFSVLIV